MAAMAAAVVFCTERTAHRMISLAFLRSFSHPPKSLSNPMPSTKIPNLQQLHSLIKVAPLAMAVSLRCSSYTTADSEISLLGKKKEGLFLETQMQQQPQRRPFKALFLWAFVWVSTLFFFLVLKCGGAAAAADSIRASSFGLKMATALQGSGWPDEVIVFALATLPVLDLRGTIPVGYWMRLDPVRLAVLSVLGNMVPVPFILLYLKRFAIFIAGRRGLPFLLLGEMPPCAPVEEFQWLGLMLFVAVPFPGTGAWTGAIVASILDLPFWSAVSANFFGVVFAGLLVNLLMNLGLKHVVATGFILFIISIVMWNVLRFVNGSMGSN